MPCGRYLLWPIPAESNNGKTGNMQGDKAVTKPASRAKNKRMIINITFFKF